MNALVTGGGGFLGSAIVRRLLERGDRVRSYSRADYPDLRSLGVELVQGDVTDKEKLAAGMAGCDVVFHVAAKPGVGGRYEEYYRTNVEGTEAVLDACRRTGAAKLVYTSSPSVVFHGDDMEGVDESVPYPDHYEAHYPATKAIAEQKVLAANGPDLATVALRPHLIWGPNDNHLIPRLLARAKAGRLRRVGKGTNKVDTVYVDNAAHAHLLAADRLAPGSPIAGKVYFITQDDPVNCWDFVDRILACAGLPPVKKSVPVGVAVAAGSLLETVYRVLRLSGEPPMMRFVARELATSHWFDISAAKRDLGYQPLVSTEEGLRRLEAWLGGYKK